MGKNDGGTIGIWSIALRRGSHLATVFTKIFSVRNRAFKRDIIPADVVGAVTFFAGPHVSFITGQTLVVDGGAYYH
jgi:NAD(P)-dependent dehydrogenase (short-subunit alcohol dehydrogenase family)